MISFVVTDWIGTQFGLPVLLNPALQLHPIAIFSIF